MQTDAPAVLYELRENISLITLNRPERSNALGAAICQGLRAALERFEQDPEAKVAIITGAGPKAFCAGLDLKEASASGMKVPPRGYLPIIGDSIEVSKPTIAAVNGVAIAGGWLIDMLPQRVMMELLLTGNAMDARRLLELGYLNAVVPAETLLERAFALAAQIAANAPLTVRACRAMVYASTEAGRGEALRTADAIFEPVYLSEDAQEGPRAFAEKRAPRWQGR